MQREWNRLRNLAARAAQGSAAAAAHLREELQPSFVHMVRCALRGGTGNAALDAWVRAEVARAFAVGAAGPDAEPERLLVLVARRLWPSVRGRLRPRPAAGPQAGFNTVCGP
jgi:hypothetical protein